MTVTAPIDMGTGQQRFVVAYTLKQGIEKQPDILSAQKSKCGQLIECNYNEERAESKVCCIAVNQYQLLMEHKLETENNIVVVFFL